MSCAGSVGGVERSQHGGRRSPSGEAPRHVATVALARGKSRDRHRRSRRTPAARLGRRDATIVAVAVQTPWSSLDRRRRCRAQADVTGVAGVLAARFEAIHHAPGRLGAEINARRAVWALAGAARRLCAIAASGSAIALQAGATVAVALAVIAHLRPAAERHHREQRSQNGATLHGASHGLARDRSIARLAHSGSSVAAAPNRDEKSAASLNPREAYSPVSGRT